MSRSRRRWLSVAFVLGIGIAAALSYRFYQVRQRALAIAAVHQEEVAALQALRQVVSVKIDRHASVREWLAEFTRQTGIAAEALPIDFDSSDGQKRELVRQFDDTFPVNIELPPSRAADLLDTLAHAHDIHWKQRPDGSIELGWPDKQESVVARHYPLPIDLTPAERASLQGLLWKYLQYNRDGVRLDGVARIYFTPGGCSLVQSPPVHLGAQRFLEQCLAAMRLAEDASTQHMLTSLDHCPHTWLHIEEATIRELEAALDRPITLSAVDMPWPDFAAELSRQAAFPIALAPDFAKHIAKLQPNLNCQVKNMPLGQVAQNIQIPSFHPFLPTEFALFPTGNGRALLMGELRGDAQADRHHHLCAYPVADLVFDSAGVSHADALETAILGATDNEWGTFHLGNYKMNFFLNGQLMVVSQRLEVHRNIQLLLTALRRIRCGRIRSQALVNDRPAKDVHERAEANAELRAILSRPTALQFSGVRLADIVQDLRDRTDIRLMPSSEVHDQWQKSPPVWCYLPKRPLGENLRILFAACGYELIEQGDQCRIEAPPPVREADGVQVSEVFDLRPWLHRPETTGVRLAETIPRLMGHRQSSVRMDEFRDLLVISGQPDEVTQVKEILLLLDEHIASSHPRRWRGEILTGERLNQPLAISKSIDVPVTREPELTARLQELVSVNFSKVNVADALLTLASRHELPLVVQRLPSDCYGLEHIITYQANAKPVRDILQELIGEPISARWQVQGGSIRVIEDEFDSPKLEDLWYSVHDLLAPVGPHRPEELLALLKPAILEGVGPKAEPQDPYLQLHVGNLLRVRSGHVSRGALEGLLRQLRGQEPRAEPQP